MTTSPARLMFLGALLLLTAAIAAGCAAASSKAVASADPQAAMQAFRDCLKKEGVELPQGGPGGPGGPGGGGERPSRPPGESGNGPRPGGPPGFSEESRAAMEACRDKLPEGGFPGGGGQLTEEQRAASEEQRAKLTACLDKAGVELPAGGPGGPGGGPGGPEGRGQGGAAPQFDDASRAAFEKCREEIGFTGGAGGPPPRP